MRFWVQEVLHTKDYRIKNSAGNASFAMKCKYLLTASLRKMRSSDDRYVKFRNEMNIDFEPGFPYSNGVVNRSQPAFLTHKLMRTTELIKAMLGSVPPSLVDEEQVPNRQRLPDGLPTDAIPHWSLDDDFEMESNTLFQMRGATARDDPGLNALFTGHQLQAAMKDMTRTVRVSGSKCRMISRFFIWPFFECIRHMNGDHQKKTMKSSAGSVRPYPHLMLPVVRLLVV